MRKIITILILISISSAGKSQFISLGAKGGAGFSMGNVYYEGKSERTDGFRRLANFNGGLMLNLKISTRWYYHSEVIFEDKGNKYVEHIDSLPRNKNYYAATLRERIHNYFIQFPQTIRFLISLSRKEKVLLYVEAGGYFAYYINSSTISHLFYDNTVESDVIKYDFGDKSDNLVTYHRFNWGATAGVGLLFPLWKGQLDLNLKYDRMIQPFVAQSNSEKNYY
ncbi:MAG: outer membrane beta-barrel protein, partial [Bacteroidales bacterium]